MAKAPTEKPFYVYRIFGEMGEVVYIGKGSGPRLQTQKRRFNADGEIIERFSTERAAYRFERKLILKNRPPLNDLGKGGTGGQYGVARGEEAIMFSHVARIIRAAPSLSDHARNSIADVLAAVAKKYGPARYAAALKTHNINVVFQS